MAPVMPLQDSRARAEQAFGLRSIGRTWREIADQLGFKSHGAAQLAVARHISRTAPESVEDARRTSVESLRITTSVLFDRFAAAVKREDDAAVVLINRELRSNRDQLAKLAGLFAPTQVDVGVTVHRSATAILDRAEAELLALSGNGNVIDAEVVAE